MLQQREYTWRLPREKLLSRFLTVEQPPTLGRADFAHMEPAVDAALRILRPALAARTAGVNLLFHGATGVGKSELARLLAAELGVVLYLAGAEDDDGDSPSVRERLASMYGPRACFAFHADVDGAHASITLPMP